MNSLLLATIDSLRAVPWCWSPHESLIRLLVAIERFFPRDTLSISLGPLLIVNSNLLTWSWPLFPSLLGNLQLSMNWTQDNPVKFRHTYSEWSFLSFLSVDPPFLSLWEDRCFPDPPRWRGVIADPRQLFASKSPLDSAHVRIFDRTGPILIQSAHADCIADWPVLRQSHQRKRTAQERFSIQCCLSHKIFIATFWPNFLFGD